VEDGRRGTDEQQQGGTEDGPGQEAALGAPEMTGNGGVAPEQAPSAASNSLPTCS
jgi:hypothetical protein